MKCQGKIREKSGNFEVDDKWQPCCKKKYHITPNDPLTFTKARVRWEGGTGVHLFRAYNVVYQPLQNTSNKQY